jgi:hypothetical protein
VRPRRFLLLLICLLGLFGHDLVVYLGQYFLQLLLQHDLCGRASLALDSGKVWERREQLGCRSVAALLTMGSASAAPTATAR